MSQERPEGRLAEVDATGNVTEDAGVVVVVGLQRLALEVVRLLARGHAGVDGTEWLEIEEAVLSGPTSRQGQGVNVVSTSPFGKSFGCDTKGVSSDMGTDPLLPAVGIHQRCVITR